MPSSPSSNFIETLRVESNRSPGKTALMAPGRTALSYGDLIQRVESAVGALKDFGVTAQDRVALVMGNGPEFAVLFLAISSFAACAPVNPAYKARDLEAALLNLRPRFVVVSADLSPHVRETAAMHGMGVITAYPKLDDQAGSFVLDLTIDENGSGARPQWGNALILQTSGTTSTPKLVGLSHTNVAASTANIVRSLKLSRNDVSLALMPLFHVQGLISALLSPLASGGTVVCCPPFQVRHFFNWLSEFRPTWYTAVPTIHAAIVARAAQDHRRDDTSLRFVRAVSSALSPKLLHDLEDLFGVPVIEAYGMTEACHQIASNPLPPGLRKPGSVGIATGAEIMVLRPNGEPAAANEDGEIVIRGRSVISGYLDNPAANIENFTNGWLRTGDVGSVDQDGYVFLKGRSKEIINRGGSKISPIEIENLLLEHPAVAEAACFAIPDVRLGEDIGAAVVLRGSATSTELRSFVAKRVAAFKAPRQIAIVADLPKSATGKLQRRQLAKILGLGQTAPGPDAPESIPGIKDLQDLLRAMWSQALNIHDVGLRDNFFALGGDSSAANELMLAVEQVTGAKLPVGALFEAPTVFEFANLIERANPQGVPRYVVPIHGAGCNPPFFCVFAGPLYWTLAKSLGEEQPFLSLLQPTEEFARLRPRFEDIAALFVRMIRAVQPEGPYFLGGWCMHGVIAYEIAQQLRDAGQEVGLLVLFDALNPGRWARYPAAAVPLMRALDWFQKTFFHLNHLRGIPLQQWTAYLRERLETVRLSFGRWRRYQKSCVSDAIAHQVRATDPDEFVRIAELHYRPKPYGGRTLIFRRTARPTGPGQDSTLGWATLVRGELHVVNVPGDHRDMFKEPQVALVARVMRNMMRDTTLSSASGNARARQTAPAPTRTRAGERSKSSA